MSDILILKTLFGTFLSSQSIARGAVAHPEEDIHKMDEQLPAEGQDGGGRPLHRPRRRPQTAPSPRDHLRRETRETKLRQNESSQVHGQDDFVKYPPSSNLNMEKLILDKLGAVEFPTSVSSPLPT